MATERRRKTDQAVTPFTDPAFRRSSVYFDDIEYQRRFEQNLIRYDLKNGAQVKGVVQNIINQTTITGGGGGGEEATGCFWTKEGSDLLYEEGMVGINCHPTAGNFEVRGTVVIEAKGDVDPLLEIRNWSDTEKDPMVQFSSGAVAIKKFSMGLDDSDADSWLLCSGDVLTSTVTGEIVDLGKAYDGTMIVVDSGNSRIKRHFTSNDMAYIAKIGSAGSGDDNFSGARGVCSDGIYVYVCDSDNYRVVKRKVADLSYVSQVGSNGTGNLQFKNPVGVCTDGVHIYVVDKINNRVTKLLCADLSFSAKTAGTEGFNNPAAICTDGISLYIIQNPGETWRMIKLTCSTLALSTRRLKDGHDNGITPQGIAYNLGYCYICQTNAGSAPVFKYRSSDLAYDSEWGVWGSGDGQLTAPYTIATNGSNIFASDVGVGFANPHRVQKYTMAGVYVAKYGTYGSGDTNFYQVYGICMVGYITGETTIPFRAPIIKASINGDWVDAYPVLRARDGIQLMEDGTVAATKYVSLLAPSAITASYDIIVPAAVPSAQGHFSISTGGQISWGQNVGTAASPSFVRVTSSVSLGTSPFAVTSSTVCANLNADLLDGSHSTAFAAATHYHDSDYISIIASPAANKFPYQTAGGELVDSTYNATSFSAAAHTHALGDLSNVNAPAPNDNDVLSWDTASGKWIPVVPGGGAGTFITLSDCPASYATHGGEFVKVKADASGLEFVASSVAGHGLVSASHTDLTVSAPNNGDILQYDSGTSKWVVAALPAGANHDILSATHGDTTAAAVARGDIIAGIGASPKWTRLAKGTAGYALIMGADEPGWVALTVYAPTNADYVVGTAQAGLSAEIVKAYMGDNEDPDSYPAAPDAMDDEFEDSSINVKWTKVNDPAGANAMSESAHLGSLWIGLPEATNPDYEANIIWLYQAAPAGTGNETMAFIAKVCVANPGDPVSAFAQYGGAGILIWNPTNHEYVGLANQLRAASSCYAQVTGLHQGAAANYALVASTTSYPLDIPQAVWVYLKLEKSTNAAWTSANTYNMYMSMNGIIWTMVGTEAKTFTSAPSRIGLFWRGVTATTGAAKAEAVVDFFRRID
jgi:hypothetical protein